LRSKPDFALAGPLAAELLLGASAGAVAGAAGHHHLSVMEFFTCNIALARWIEWRAIAFGAAQGALDHAQMAAVAGRKCGDHDRTGPRVTPGASDGPAHRPRS
jgi:hypothetical protein